MNSGYDAIVVGGGPSGATAAALLAQAGWRIAVIEKTPFPRQKVCGEFISATTWPLLRQLGIAASLLEIAGPVVRRVGLYAGDAMVSAELSAPAERADEGGRALGREHLDTLLISAQPNWVPTSGNHGRCRSLRQTAMATIAPSSKKAEGNPGLCARG